MLVALHRVLRDAKPKAESLVPAPALCAHFCGAHQSPKVLLLALTSEVYIRSVCSALRGWRCLLRKSPQGCRLRPRHPATAKAGGLPDP